MRKIYVFCGLISAFSYSQGQNLVPNPSFEDTTLVNQHSTLLDCTTSGCTSFFWCSSWFDGSYQTPDYYNSRSGDIGNSVPNNQVGFQNAHTGNAYGGGVAYEGKWLSNVRDYISVELLSPLISGKNYNVGFYVSLADSSLFAINRMGAYLSIDTSESGIGTNLPFIPQIENSQDSILKKNNWTLISGTYLSKGGEKYITIGNFYPDSLTTVDSLHHGNFNWGAYYYIDDVSVTPSNSDDGIQNFSNTSSFSIFPNPNDGTMQFDYSLATGSIGDFMIYTLSGVKLADYRLGEGDNATLRINENNLSPGLYFYSEIINGTAVTTGKLVIIK